MAFPANQRTDFDPSLSRPSPPPNLPQQQQNLQLPEGACNYRDLSAGPKPPACGCRRFWLGPTFGRVGLGLSQAPEPWCACGHHACFHERSESTRAREKSTASSLTSKESLAGGQRTIGWQQQTEPTQPWTRHGMLRDDEAGRDIQSGPAPIPSFHLTSSELRGHANYRGSVGLGLDFSKGIYATRKVTQSPTVADVASLGDGIPSTRQPSSEDRVSPSNAFMRHIANARREVPRLDTNNVSLGTIGLGLGDLVQSATEVATPSLSAVSNATNAAQLIQEAVEVVTILEQGVSEVDEHPMADVNAAAATNSIDRDTVSSPSSQTIRNALRQIPAALQRLGPLLNSLQNQVARHPDLSIHESINSLVKRMDALENASFNQLPPEQVHDQFQHIDVRLSELEAMTNEHSRTITAMEPNSDPSGMRTPTKKTLFENTSFTSYASGQSLDSATSSALIAAAIDRVEATERLKAVEDRLDTLEAFQMPSTAMPWNMEVVLLPWGRALRGIWYEASDLKRSATTQDDEDVTQGAVTGKGNIRQARSLAESGWNDQMIRDWASGDADHLFAKAPGVNGVVYHRLKSRGLVRNVVLAGPGARDLITALVKAFGEMLDSISGPDSDQEMDEDGEDDGLMGLTAPFLPLRKVHKSSCLRFLDENELVTPTLWNADFLAAGVLMRASGGQKRLFITTRRGYTQDIAQGWTWSGLRQLPRVHEVSQRSKDDADVPEADALEPCWRHHPALDIIPSAQTSFHSDACDSGYVEAHALTQASRSALSAMKQLGTGQAPGSSRLLQPITPVSEFPPTSQHHRKARTLSTSISDGASTNKFKAGSLPHPGRPVSQQSKRRVRSFEQSANPALIAALPTFVPSPGKGSVRANRIKKRRRLTRSRSSSSPDLQTQSSGQMDAQSLHPEADPNLVLEHLQEVIPQGGEIKPLGHFWPRSRSRETVISLPVEGVVGGAERSIQGRTTDKRGVTPSAYATPFSGTVAEIGDQDKDYLPSESGEDDWGGVDEDESNTDEHEIDDDMSDEDSSGGEEDDASQSGGDGGSKMLHVEDEDMLSSEDELQLQT